MSRYVDQKLACFVKVEEFDEEEEEEEVPPDQDAFHIGWFNDLFIFNTGNLMMIIWLHWEKYRKS